MAGGGKANSQPTTQNVNQSSLPEYARPYFERLMSNAEAASNQPYQTYSGPRIAGFNGQQQQAFGLAGNLPNTYTGTAQQGIGLTQLAAANAAGSSGYQAGTLNPTQVTAQTIANPAGFDTAAATRLMNPYINDVLNTQLAQAQRVFNQQQVARNGQRVMSGAFGGYRQGVQDAVAQGQFGQQQDSATANGLYQAYLNAQQQFNTENALGMDVSKANAGNALQAAIANQQAGTSAFGLNEQAKLNQSNNELARNSQLGTLAQQLAAMGYNLQDADMKSIDALSKTGLQQQQQQQASLDLAYQDFMAQQNYDKNNLSFMSDILHGVPVSASTTQSTYQNTNPYSQLLGLGVNAAALSQALGGQNA